MVLSREELSRALQHEIKILLHLASKLEPGMLDYRPTPKQRSTLELLRYLSAMTVPYLRSPRLARSAHRRGRCMRRPLPGAVSSKRWQ